jgi:prevent-host-death family protein
MITVNIHEAKMNLLKLLQRVMNGEEVIIAKADEPVARLVPYTKALPKRLPGSAAGEVIISPNFDDPLPEFEL